MASKNKPAPVVAAQKTPAERIAELKKQRDEAAAELKKLNDEAAAAEAKEFESNKAKRESATATLAVLLRSYAADLSDPVAVVAISGDAILRSLEVEQEIVDSKSGAKTIERALPKKHAKLKAAVEALIALGGIKPPRKASANGNGTPRAQTGEVKVSQKRILTYLASLPKGSTASRRQLACVALGKPFDTTDRVTTFGGEVIGNIRDDNGTHPYSLLARGWVELVESDHEGQAEKAIALTDAGRKAAVENTVELTVTY